MNVLNNTSYTRVSTKILTMLYKYRGMDINHLLFALYPEKYNRETFNTLSSKEKNKATANLYSKYLPALKKEGLIYTYKASSTTSKAPRQIYYLTKNGLEFMREHLDILPGEVGEGYGNDYGYFEFETYRPPLKHIRHHNLLIDLFLEIESLKMQDPSLEIDYRDNRYCSEKYELDSGKGKEVRKFMPDGEVKINGKVYWVEIDRDTEYSEQLEKKFIGYNEYMNFLYRSGREVADGILFIREEPMSRTRWVTVSSAFLNNVGDWSSEVNLMLGSLSDISYLLKREHNSEEYTPFSKSFINKIKYYASENELNLHRADYQNGDMFSLSIALPKKNDKKCFVFERCDGFETIGIGRFLKLYKTYKNSGITVFKKIEQFYPVFFTYQGTPVTLNEKMFIDNDGKNNLLFDTKWIDISDDPKWYDVNHRRIRHPNPLLIT